MFLVQTSFGSVRLISSFLRAVLRPISLKWPFLLRLSVCVPDSLSNNIEKVVRFSELKKWFVEFLPLYRSN